MPPRHLIVGGGAAGLNAIRTIREEDGGESEITLVATADWLGDFARERAGHVLTMAGAR